MRAMKLLALSVIVAGASFTPIHMPGQAVKIESLDHNGRLTWTVPSTNAVCTIEWAPSVTSDWRNNWLELTDIRTTITNLTVPVPMFYRVLCWTNGLFVSLPVGRIYEYTGSNSLGETWTSQWICAGMVLGMSTNFTPSAGKDRWILVVKPETEVFLPHDSHREHEMNLLRSTGNAFYSFDGPGQENMWWQDAALGTTWTNSIRETYAVCTVVATDEQVGVAAGNFNCIRIRTRYFGSGLPARTETWVAPRVTMVKEVRFIADTNPVPDEVYQLRLWYGQ